MKRHLNNLLQRKRAEFEGSNDMDRLPSNDNPDVTVVQVKDGYDWLLQIKPTAASHALQA
jgi:hypothetical protein